ncbi:hypothetical protein J2Z40_002471 [Cytobacillus eiseniae]|uniref:Uncharacterized protein n=1 Tax=Cytobacillus eiseniae TaxID=762947 RepID=A0ABS4RGK0_9BACI|nr:hypothetical protein [Cytobacillus eiseniae]
MNFLLETQETDKNVSLQTVINHQYTMVVFVRHLG